MGTSSLRGVLGAAAIVLIAVAAGSARPRPVNLVIVTLDTTRADRLPAYGFSSVATPALDRLTAQGVIFDRAESVAPLTLAAHTSLFTGLYPPRHGVRDNADAPLETNHVTLAETLHARGFRTAAFVGSIVLGADRGLARGFDVYDEGGGKGVPRLRRRPANEVVESAQGWIEGLDSRPFLLWVHLYDVHAPQSPPLEFRRAYADGYEAAIAYVDTQVGRLLDALERKRLLDSSVVVVAGDHGESLGEHGEREHGIFLYEATMRVPLVIRASGLRPRHARDLVSLVDVVPTVFDLLGIQPSGAADGQSLLPALRGRHLPERSVYGESMYAQRFGWSPLRMVRDGRMKYIDAPRPELYDLEADPQEQHDLSSERPRVVAAMHSRMAAVGDGIAAPPDGGSVEAAARREALAALGYTSGHAEASPALPRLDPKDYIQVYNAVRGRAGR